MTFSMKKHNLIVARSIVVFFMAFASFFNFSSAQALFGFGGSDVMQTPFIDANQKQITLSQFKGKPLVINFWATWCPQCVKKMASVNSFASQFDAKGGQVLAISEDRGGLSKVRSYYAREGFRNLPIYLDSTGQLLKAFGVNGLPTTIFINAQGQEVGRVVGGFDLESPQSKGMIQKYFGITM